MTTDWSLVRTASDKDAFERLIACYWTPIFAYIRAKGHDEHEAADITQEFIASVMIGRDLVLRANQERGSFRSFLLSSLKRFIIDQRRKSVRHHRSVVALDLTSIPNDDHSRDPDVAFQREWSRRVMNEALVRTRLECYNADQETHWLAFELRVLAQLRGGAALSNEEVASQIGIEPEVVSPRVQTVKRKLKAMTRQIVLETISDPEMLDNEHADIVGGWL